MNRQAPNAEGQVVTEMLFEQQLTDWLYEHLGVGPDISVSRLGGGNSNQTFVVTDTGGGSTAGTRLVVRLPRAAAMAAGAHNLAREHRILRAVCGAGFPAPKPYAFCDYVEVLGQPFLVMEHVDGHSITTELPAAYADAAVAGAIGGELVEALAQLEAIDWKGAGLEDFGKPANFLDRQVPRWRRQLEQYRVRDLPRFDEVAEWLQDNQPDGQDPAIIHGDFHLDNCLLSPDSPQLAAVIDWELSTIGDPLLDLGLFLAFWGPRPTEPCAMPQIQAVSRHYPVPDRMVLAARYGEQTGRAVDALPYYCALALWKLAAIVEGAYAQFLRGEVVSAYTAALERDVPLLLEEAWRHANGEGP